MSRVDVAISTCSTNAVDSIIPPIVDHAFKGTTLHELKIVTNPNPILIDVRGFFDEKEASQSGIQHTTL